MLHEFPCWVSVWCQRWREQRRCARLPSPTGRRPRVTHSRDRRGLFGSVAREGRRNFRLLTTLVLMVTDYSKFEICETVSTFSAPVDRCAILYIKCTFLFWTPVPTFSYVIGQSLTDVRFLFVFWALRARSTRFSVKLFCSQWGCTSFTRA